MENPKDRLLTVPEVAEYFRVDPESIRRWLREGRLLGINLGRAAGWRIKISDVEAFVEERLTKRGQNPPTVEETEATASAGAVAAETDESEQREATE